MPRHFCHTCEVLKEIYWLKASRFAYAVRAAGRSTGEDDIQAFKDDAMQALRTLLRHINACYGFTLEKAA